MRKSSGFTLIELLIAVSLAAIVILGIYSAFQSGTSSYEKINASIDASERARLVFARLEADLRNSFIYSAQEARFSGKATSLDFCSAQNDIARRVIYNFNNGSLTRAVYGGISGFKTPPEGAAESISWLIKGITLEFANANTYANDEWLPSWPPEAASGAAAPAAQILPAAIRVKLSIRQEVFTKIIALPLGEKRQ
jgi:prepilin-type N-terminal cleavage/methylation domain-containing protein